MPSQEARVFHAASAYKDRYIIVTGGLETYKSTERYCIESDRWETLAPLNKKRTGHSSCIFGKQVYVFFGVRVLEENSNGNKLDFVCSTEKLSLDCLGAGWQEINFYWMRNIALTSMNVVAMSAEEFVILGGVDRKNHPTGRIFILDFQRNA